VVVCWAVAVVPVCRGSAAVFVCREFAGGLVGRPVIRDYNGGRRRGVRCLRVDASRRRKAAPEGRRRRPVVGMVQQLDALRPLHPLKASCAGGHESDGRAVVVAQRLAADVGGEQQPLRVVAGEAPAVSRTRRDATLTWRAAGRASASSRSHCRRIPRHRCVEEKPPVQSRVATSSSVWVASRLASASCCGRPTRPLIVNR
jgi:hypothetical protein